eukprot:TRINITY_DN3628_c0_g3_i1.p1 TRINITY_DN3628_c0_g3~~TRINITY_DN3628_c0_g3_i1.p1  ORF type:complete len:652 (+),score=147.18 TRINITY_DN3628_c0_g3_i1:282-2237(+)
MTDHLDQHFIDIINGNVTALPPMNSTFQIPHSVKANDSLFIKLVDWDIQAQQSSLMAFVNDTVVPLVVTGHGNCLLHAVSKACWGTESYANLLYTKLNEELSNNSGFYINLVGNERFWTHVQESRDGLFRFFHIFALSNLLCRPIFVYAPPELVMMHGQGEGGVASTFVPSRHSSDECNAPPIALAFSSSPKLVYVPVVSYEGCRVVWPILPAAYASFMRGNESVDKYIIKSMNGPIIVPPVQSLIQDVKRLEEYTKQKLPLNQNNNNNPISQIKDLKSKYDLVWQIEMGGGMQTYICYNVGDNPEALARKFVEKHGIQSHYDKIKNFIYSQIYRAQNDPTLSPLFDPNRPKRNQNTTNNNNINNPFLNQSQPNTLNKPQENSFKHFPYRGDKLSYSTAKFPLIIKKIHELNKTLVDDHLLSFKLMDDDFETLDAIPFILDSRSSLSEVHFNLIEKLFNWPSDKIFPILDLFRMMVDGVHSLEVLSTIPSLLYKFFSLSVDSRYTNPTNMFLILKTLVNMTKSDHSFVRHHSTSMQKIFLYASTIRNKNVLNCLAAVMLNCTMITSDFSREFHQTQIKVILNLLSNTDIEDEDTITKGLVALGSLLVQHSSAPIFPFEDRENFKFLQSKLSKNSQTINECVEDLRQLILQQ